MMSIRYKVLGIMPKIKKKNFMKLSWDIKQNLTWVLGGVDYLSIKSYL